MSDPLLTEMLRMTEFQSHLITVDQYQAKVTLLIGGTHEQHVEAFKRRRVAKQESSELADYCRDQMKDCLAVVLYTASRPGAFFVYFPQKPDLTRPAVVGTVSHEMFHVTIGILRRAEVRLTDASEEAFAYLHGHLMQEVWKKLD